LDPPGRRGIIAAFQEVRDLSARVTPPRQRPPVEQSSTGAPPPIELGEAERCALLGGIARGPDISILSDEFLADARGLPQRNVAVELLRKLPE
jgi:hypothetical protein